MREQEVKKQKTQKKEKKKKFRNERFLIIQPFDWKLLLTIICINIIGIGMIYSASYFYASEKLGLKGTYFFTNQLKFFVFGFIIMILLSFFRFQKISGLWWLALILGIAIVGAVKIRGLGYSSHGANRWIRIGGVSLQVAEVCKVLMIFGLAGYIRKYLPQMNLKKARFWIYVIIVVGTCGLILFLTNNFSSAFIVGLIGFFMLMMVHPKQKFFYICIAVAVLVAIVIVIYFKFAPYQEDENFRFVRIRAWLDPTNPLYATDEAYQATQGFYAIASGGFFGKGLGQSLIKFTMPEPHNDYILAIMFEEVGVVGVLVLTLLFIYLLYKIQRIYAQTPDPFMRYLVLGVFIHIASQVTLNYLVVLGVFPTTGVTLPFISAGGSSLLFLFIELGFVLSADKQRNESQVYKEAQEQIEKDHPEYLEMKKKPQNEAAGNQVVKKDATPAGQNAKLNSKKEEYKHGR